MSNEWISVVLTILACATFYFWIGVGVYKLAVDWFEDGPTFVLILLWPLVVCIAAIRL